MKKEDRERLEGLGLDPDAPNLVSPAKAVVKDDPDLRSVPAENIIFPPELLAEFPDLESAEVRKKAADHIFAMYKSPARDKPRNSLLWRRISTFINEQRMSRKTGGHIKEKVKTTKEQRDLAQVLAGLDISVDDLLALAKKKQEEAND